MKRLLVTFAVLGLMTSTINAAQAATVTFTASDIKATMASYGDDLSDLSHQWGLWAVRARPVVLGGSFTITGASTDQTGWGTTAPSSYSWNTYGTNCAWFWDESGAEVAGTAANPLYMIMDVADENWWSSGFNKDGTWVADWAPGPDGSQGTSDDLGTFYASGYDDGAGGTNVITAVNDASTFSFDFTIDSGTWNGQWEFLVDGSKYSVGSSASPGGWIENFWGDYGTGGGLSTNMGSGYAVPVPAAVWLLGSGIIGLVGIKRKFRS
ncbi:MAG: VPLPA-CTERM sorting domain-containing protein [Thermodesulfobacteriota bacterium]|nr:VPLPA-CTERM sorting domain-containing protein [Thermodesulfobacteriota bacterium]